jgi:hypothetical protein
LGQDESRVSDVSAPVANSSDWRDADSSFPLILFTAFHLVPPLIYLLHHHFSSSFPCFFPLHLIHKLSLFS